MTAFHSMMLLLVGTALTPLGGSCCRRLKSLISLRRAGVDMASGWGVRAVRVGSCNVMQLLNINIEVSVPV